MHAKSGEPALIEGYGGSSLLLGKALADWAETHGDQNVKDHAALTSTSSSSNTWVSR